MGLYLDFYLITDYDETSKVSYNFKKYEIPYDIGEKILSNAIKQNNSYFIEKVKLLEFYVPPIDSENMYIIQTCWASFSMEDMNNPNDINLFIKII